MNQPSNDVFRSSSPLWRALRIGANVIMFFVVLAAFGSCEHWEGTAHPLAESKGWWLEIASVCVIVLAGAVGILGFAIPSKGERGNMLGIALTVLWGIVSFVLVTIFWFGATCGPSVSFCELWRSAPPLA